MSLNSAGFYLCLSWCRIPNFCHVKDKGGVHVFNNACCISSDHGTSVKKKILIYEICISVLPLNIALNIKGIYVNFEIHNIVNCYERVPDWNEFICILSSWNRLFDSTSQMVLVMVMIIALSLTVVSRPFGNILTHVTVSCRWLKPFLISTDHTLYQGSCETKRQLC